MNPIALLSDLGEKDYFVGAMKGVILSINPEANIVDISHNIPKHDIHTGAFVLLNASKTFPDSSIFLAVIDPGVGTERRCILLRTKNDMNFIGPDNGVFTLVANNFEVKEMREITNEKLMRSKVSNTFHGRDVMGPVGAHLSLGVKPSKVGPEIEELKLLDLKEPELKNNEVHGQIMKIDNFGNLVTNISEDLIKKLGKSGEPFEIDVGRYQFQAPFVETFGDVPEGKKLCYVGSVNSLEIAKNRGNLAEEIGAENAEQLNIRLTR